MLLQRRESRGDLRLNQLERRSIEIVSLRLT